MGWAVWGGAIGLGAVETRSEGRALRCEEHGHASKVAGGSHLMSLGLGNHSNSKHLCGIFMTTKDFMSTENSSNVHGDPM